MRNHNPVDEVEGDPEELRRDLERSVECRPGITGRTWTRAELLREFTLLGEQAPVVAVQRKADGVKGSMMTLRGLYWGFEAASEGD